MKNVREVYESAGSGDYLPLLQSFEYEIILKIDDDDYQGDSRVLFKNGSQYGVLIFGWGSCSGCDALQACGSFDEVEELQKEIHEKIIWGNTEEILAYLEKHDWTGDFSDCIETREFVEGAITIVEKQQFDVTLYLQPIHTITKVRFETLKQQLESEFNRVMDEEHPPADYTKLNELSDKKNEAFVECEKANALRYGFANILTTEEHKALTDEYTVAQEKHSDMVRLYSAESQRVKNIEKQRLLAKARWLLSHRELLFSEWIRINKNTHEIHETFQRDNYHYEMVRNAWIDEIDDIHPKNLVEYKFMNAEKVTNGF